MQIHPRCFLPKTALATWLDNILNVKKWVILSKKKNQICQSPSLKKSRIAFGHPTNINEQVPAEGYVLLKWGKNTDFTYVTLVLGCKYSSQVTALDRCGAHPVHGCPSVLCTCMTPT